MALGHTAEAILQYVKNIDDAPEIRSSAYEGIKFISKPPNCQTDDCKAINCPFKEFHSSYNITCINVHQLQLLEETPSEQLPEANPTQDCDDCLHFMNFNFEGDAETSAINGRNNILPPVPPLTQLEDFRAQAKVCNQTVNCDQPTLDCTCTHMINIPSNKTVQFVFTALGSYLNSHPIHLHGHTFHVVDIGYPEYNQTTGFITCQNRKIECGNCYGPRRPECNPKQCTKPSWASNKEHPSFTISSKTIRKDTVIVPAGGYVVINFLSDNPGYWFLHCHIEVHQLEGMALIVNEASDRNITIPPTYEPNKCGN